MHFSSSFFIRNSPSSAGSTSLSPAFTLTHILYPHMSSQWSILTRFFRSPPSRYPDHAVFRFFWFFSHRRFIALSRNIPLLVSPLRLCYFIYLLFIPSLFDLKGRDRRLHEYWIPANTERDHRLTGFAFDSDGNIDVVSSFRLCSLCLGQRAMFEIESLPCGFFDRFSKTAKLNFCFTFFPQPHTRVPDLILHSSYLPSPPTTHQSLLSLFPRLSPPSYPSRVSIQTK